MANLTITVDERVLKKARMRALEEDTSVNAVLRDYLERYSGVRQERREAWRRIQELAEGSAIGSGGERLPNREELYEERLGRYRGR